MRKTCPKCKQNLRIELFTLKRNDNYTSTCTKCLDYQREYYHKVKCEHDVHKYACHICRPHTKKAKTRKSAIVV